MSHFNTNSGQRHRTGPEDEGSSPDTKLSAASWSDYDWRILSGTRSSWTMGIVWNYLRRFTQRHDRLTWFQSLGLENPSQIPTTAFLNAHISRFRLIERVNNTWKVTYLYTRIYLWSLLCFGDFDWLIPSDQGTTPKSISEEASNPGQTWPNPCFFL